jgi:hypothetical protein
MCILTVGALCLVVRNRGIQRLVDKDSRGERYGRIVDNIVHTGVADVLEVAVSNG